MCGAAEQYVVPGRCESELAADRRLFVPVVVGPSMFEGEE
jgi:hypothetical protein